MADSATLMAGKEALKALYRAIKPCCTPLLTMHLKRKLSRRADFFYRHDWASANYANWQHWLAPYKGQDKLVFLEIGSQEGRSAVWFLTTVLTHPNARLFCVDPMLGTNETVFRHNIKLSGAADKVTLIQKKSDEALPYLPENHFDFIYVDGSHRAMNVLADSVYSWQLLKKDGLLLFDDYLWQPDQPKHQRCQYPIDLFLKHFDPQLEVIHKGYQVLVKKTA